MFRTSNPTLNDRVFRAERAHVSGESMTINGTINRTGFLTLLVVAASLYSWQQTAAGTIGPFIWVGAIGGFIVAMVTVFKPAWSPMTAPIYALLEGLVLGALSALLEASFPGIALQAVLLTFGILMGLLIAYRAGLIRATPLFQKITIVATMGIALIYLLTFGLSFFGVSIPFIHGSGMLGIGFSLFVIIIASMNLIMDFDFIERGAQSGLPKYMEWYAAFTLMVTLVWLYIEVIKLLTKLRSRD